MKNTTLHVYITRGANFRKSGKVHRTIETGAGHFYEVEFFSSRGPLSGKRDLVNASYCRSILKR